MQTTSVMTGMRPSFGLQGVARRKCSPASVTSQQANQQPKFGALFSALFVGKKLFNVTVATLAFASLVTAPIWIPISLAGAALKGNNDA